MRWKEQACVLRLRSFRFEYILPSALCVPSYSIQLHVAMTQMFHPTTYIINVNSLKTDVIIKHKVGSETDAQKVYIGESYDPLKTDLNILKSLLYRR